jgi:hypothetical protein
MRLVSKSVKKDIQNEAHPLVPDRPLGNPVSFLDADLDGAGVEISLSRSV